MINLTVREIMEDTVEDDADTYIYLFRDREVIFYVGQSCEILNRLADHLGVGNRRGLSRVGRLVHNNLPASLDWTVELYTLPDCASILQPHLLSMGFVWNYDAIYSARFFDFTLEMTEKAMIEHHHPCLNTHHNSNGAPLPEKYRYKGTTSSQFLKI